MKSILEEGMEWAVRNKYAWPEDVENVEDRGCIPGGLSKNLGQRSVHRGMTQLGTLGSGNHYVEIQVVDQIYDVEKARVMGITKVGQVCVMLHCGSRGLGHQVAEEAIREFDAQLAQGNVKLVDRQLSCRPIGSPEAQKYLSAMAAAANFAFVNRTLIASNIRSAFEAVFGKSSRELDMSVVYDVAHNIAKQEEHFVDGEYKNLLVHRKGSSRAFGPNHPSLPDHYKPIGQPVLIGGSMGTYSYVLTGTENAMKETFGSTCHGAGRALGRSVTKKLLQPEQVVAQLKAKGIDIRVGQLNAVVEEAPEAYKDVCEVVDVCERAGISHKVLRLVPVGVIKG
jgi:tRNA-splicing ligase RtcB